MEQPKNIDPCIYVGQLNLVGAAYTSECLYNNRIKALKQKLHDKAYEIQEKAIKKQIVVSELINRKLEHFIKQKISKNVSDIALYIPNTQDIDRSLRNEFISYSVLKNFMSGVLHPILLSRFKLFEPATGFITGLFKSVLPSAIAPSGFKINERVVPLFHEYLSLCEQYGISLLSDHNQDSNLEFLQERFEALELALSRIGIEDVTEVLSLYIYVQHKDVMKNLEKTFYKPQYLGSLTSRLSSLQARTKSLIGK